MSHPSRSHPEACWYGRLGVSLNMFEFRTQQFCVGGPEYGVRLFAARNRYNKLQGLHGWRVIPFQMRLSP
eukprot:3816248-Pyramimonas_sp.AAC.1